MTLSERLDALRHQRSEIPELHEPYQAMMAELRRRSLTIESIRDHSVCWQSFRSIRRTEAQRRKASAFRLRSVASPEIRWTSIAHTSHFSAAGRRG
jgi:hypothetical protein